jgi:hypothetical protein
MSNRLRQIWRRIIAAANARLDWTADLVEGRPDRDVCMSCGERRRSIYLTRTTEGWILCCDRCRAAWHQIIRDYYAHRAAAVAAETAEAMRLARERKEAA